jgi:hypothetical protein
MTTTMDPLPTTDLLDYEVAEETPEALAPHEDVASATPRPAGRIPWTYVGVGAIAGVGIGLTVGMIVGTRLRKGDDHSVRMGPIRPMVKWAPSFAPELEVSAFNNRQSWAFGRRMGAKRRQQADSRKRVRRPGIFAMVFRRRSVPALPAPKGRDLPFALPIFAKRLRAA